MSKIITAENWLYQPVTLLNASFEALGTEIAMESVSRVVKGGAIAIENHASGFQVRSQHVTVPLPSVVQLTKYVFVKFKRSADEHSRVTFPAILERDKRTCGYCGSFANTVDHIVPKSRGGKETWGNCIAACGPCNNWKADRTPEEAGMELLWPPKVPNSSDKLQKKVWRSLENLHNSESARPVA